MTTEHAPVMANVEDYYTDLYKQQRRNRLDESIHEYLEGSDPLGELTTDLHSILKECYDFHSTRLQQCESIMQVLTPMSYWCPKQDNH